MSGGMNWDRAKRYEQRQARDAALPPSAKQLRLLADAAHEVGIPPPRVTNRRDASEQVALVLRERDRRRQGDLTRPKPIRNRALDPVLRDRLAQAAKAAREPVPRVGCNEREAWRHIRRFERKLKRQRAAAAGKATAPQTSHSDKTTDGEAPPDETGQVSAIGDPAA